MKEVIEFENSEISGLFFHGSKKVKQMEKTVTSSS